MGGVLALACDYGRAGVAILPQLIRCAFEAVGHRFELAPVKWCPSYMYNGSRVGEGRNPLLTVPLLRD